MRNLSLCLALSLAACTKKADTPPLPSTPPATTPEAGAQATTATGGIHDAGAIVDAAPGPMIAGLFPQTPVMSDMDWPVREREDGRRPNPERKGAVRIGYIRQGGLVAVVPEAHPKSNCPEGWYELVDGGFVCGRYATLDMNHPRLKLSAHPPYLDQPLPYQYGYNITNGTPLYKTAPSREDRLKFEPWLKPRARVKPVVVPEDTTPYAADSIDAGMTPTAIALTAGASPNDPLTAFDPWDSGVPWYLRDFDGGKPQITLDELKEDGGPISRRMVTGFYLALDKEFETGPTKALRWWRTTGKGFITPYDRIFVAKPAHRLPRRLARAGPVSGRPRLGRRGRSRRRELHDHAAPGKEDRLPGRVRPLARAQVHAVGRPQEGERGRRRATLHRGPPHR